MSFTIRLLNIAKKKVRFTHGNLVLNKAASTMQTNTNTCALLGWFRVCAAERGTQSRAMPAKIGLIA